MSPESTTPKPFVFVLMPFAAEYDDIYRFGIKGAADDVGAYAERIDEQIFTEGMLDRIFNQISKADVIVADMTGRNPNVFYEVGYAHALGKIVLLLTKTSDDIPFDLKHRQHTVYQGRIETLRRELVNRLTWAITESRRKATSHASERLSVRLLNADLSYTAGAADAPIIAGAVAGEDFRIGLQIRNDSLHIVNGITHAYLFAAKDLAASPAEYVRDSHTGWGASSGRSWLIGGPIQEERLVPKPLHALSAASTDAEDGRTRQYRLPLRVGTMPPGAVETDDIAFVFRKNRTHMDDVLRLRLHTDTRFHEYYFRLRVEIDKSVLDRKSQANSASDHPEEQSDATQS